MAVFNEYGDPKWIRFLGGRKFAMAIIVLALAACAFFIPEKGLDGYQFGGILVTALGLYSWNNRKQKATTSENPSYPMEKPQK